MSGKVPNSQTPCVYTYALVPGRGGWTKAERVLAVGKRAGAIAHYVGSLKMFHGKLDTLEENPFVPGSSLFSLGLALALAGFLNLRCDGRPMTQEDIVGQVRGLESNQLSFMKQLLQTIGQFGILDDYAASIGVPATALVL